MRIPSYALVSALGLAVCAASAAPSALDNRSPTEPETQAVLVYDNGGWVECIRARSNGDILLPYTTKPELWSLDPVTKNATKVLTLDGPFLGLTGITEVLPDYFAVLSGNFSTTTGVLDTGSWGVWTVDFRGCGDGPPKAKFIKQVPESRFFLGASKFNDHTIFIADGGQGLLYKMDLDTGDYSVVLKDITMDRNNSLAGIHGVNYVKPYVYYSNTFRGGFFKLEVDKYGDVVGQPSEISALGADDRLEEFAPYTDGNIYMGVQAGTIKKISPDGQFSLFVNVDPPTTCTFGRGPHDKNVLYIGTKFGSVFAATVE
jgi:hypothetical protein